jgi:hypothetical protein
LTTGSHGPLHCSSPLATNSAAWQLTAHPDPHHRDVSPTTRHPGTCGIYDGGHLLVYTLSISLTMHYGVGPMIHRRSNTSLSWHRRLSRCVSISRCAFDFLHPWWRRKCLFVFFQCSASTTKASLRYNFCARHFNDPSFQYTSSESSTLTFVKPESYGWLRLCLPISSFVVLPLVLSSSEPFLFTLSLLGISRGSCVGLRTSPGTSESKATI